MEKIKLNPIIILIAIVIGVYIGFSTKKQISSQDEMLSENRESESSSQEALPSDYTEDLMQYLSENEFEILPVFRGATSNIYTAKKILGDSKVLVQLDVYVERKSNKILLIETIIDASHYVNHPQQKQVLNMVNEVTESYFSHFVKIPYNGSNPEKASEWVISKLPTSFNFDADEKTTTKIGPATLNIYGTPLMRFLEIDFGYY